MSDFTKSFWKGFVRTIEIALLMLLILVIFELLLTYKHAHDRPELYVADSAGMGDAWREGRLAEAPPAMAPAPPMQPGVVGAQPARPVPERRGVAPQPAWRNPDASPPAVGQGAGSRAPGLLRFPMTRGRIVAFFSGGNATVYTNQSTNAPSDSAQTNEVSQSVEGEPSGERAAGYLAPQIERPDRRGLESTNGFRLAIP